MNKYLQPLSVPDADALSAVQDLCDIAAPYASGEAVDALFASAMNETNAWHAQRSSFFRELWSAEGSPIVADISELAKLPYVHANFFKAHEVVSIPAEEVALGLTSSGTTGQRSQMFFDEWSIGAAQRMVAFIFDANGWITPPDETPVNYLLSSYEPRAGFDVGTAFTDNYLCEFAPAGSVEYALRRIGSGHEFDSFGCVRALLRFAEEGAPVRIFGFPAFVYFVLERMRELGVPPLRLHPDSLVFFGGGWKGHADKQIGKAELYGRIGEQLGIPDRRLRDGYGSIEHCVPYIECEHHQLHVPVWSRVLVRSIADLRPLPMGEPGYLQVISPYITSAPAQSVLMGDLVSLRDARDCPCELGTPWFVVHGRAGVSRSRSCAVAAAELIGASSRKGA